MSKNFRLLKGDCLKELKKIKDNSIDAVVTDPPYGLSFMGKKWDYDVPSVEVWREVFRVLKPGGHVLSFGGTRTYHRMVVNIEDAGFEIRDQVMWIYGSGFPKSTDVRKRIDKEAGAEREVVGKKITGADMPSGKGTMQLTKKTYKDESGKIVFDVTAPATSDAKTWQGWGTALKPANEPICLARKPLEKGLTVAENVLKYGCGAINVDGCRIEYASENDKNSAIPQGRITTKKTGVGAVVGGVNNYEIDRNEWAARMKGRWPANILFDEDAAAVLDEQSGDLKSGGNTNNKSGFKNEYVGGDLERPVTTHLQREKHGGASRFFYVAKASKRERNAGLEGMPKISAGIGDERPSGQSMQRLDGREARQNQNHHPTVKPIKLMEYLIKLITPPNGIVLDPFMGSGSTGIAAQKLDKKFIGIERDDNYFEIAKKRIESTNDRLQLRG